MAPLASLPLFTGNYLDHMPSGPWMEPPTHLGPPRVNQSFQAPRHETMIIRPSEWERS